MQILLTDDKEKIDNQYKVPKEMDDLIEGAYADVLRHDQLRYMLAFMDRTPKKYYKLFELVRGDEPEILHDSSPLWMRPASPDLPIEGFEAGKKYLMSADLYYSLNETYPRYLGAAADKLSVLFSRYNMLPLTNWKACSPDECVAFFRSFNYRIDKIVLLGDILSNIPLSMVLDNSTLCEAKKNRLLHYPTSVVYPPDDMVNMYNKLCADVGLKAIYVSEKEFKRLPGHRFYEKIRNFSSSKPEEISLEDFNMFMEPYIVDYSRDISEVAELNRSIR